MPKLLFVLFALATISSGSAFGQNFEDPNLVMKSPESAKFDFEAASLADCPICLANYLKNHAARTDEQVDITNSTSAPGAHKNTSDTK